MPALLEVYGTWNRPAKREAKAAQKWNKNPRSIMWYLKFTQLSAVSFPTDAENIIKTQQKYISL